MSNKWAPLKRLRDWEGREVIAHKDIRNRGGDVIPKGSHCFVDSTSSYGMTLRQNRVSISRVKVSDVELVR